MCLCSSLGCCEWHDDEVKVKSETREDQVNSVALFWRESSFTSCPQRLFSLLNFFKSSPGNMFIDFRERGSGEWGERDRDRETSILCL